MPDIKHFKVDLATCTRHRSDWKRAKRSKFNLQQGQTGSGAFTASYKGTQGLFSDHCLPLTTRPRDKNIRFEVCANLKNSMCDFTSTVSLTKDENDTETAPPIILQFSWIAVQSIIVTTLHLWWLNKTTVDMFTFKWWLNFSCVFLSISTGKIYIRSVDTFEDVYLLPAVGNTLLPMFLLYAFRRFLYAIIRSKTSWCTLLRWPKKEEGATSEKYRQMQDGKTGEINYKHLKSSTVGKGLNFQTGQRRQHWWINYSNKWL